MDLATIRSEIEAFAPGDLLSGIGIVDAIKQLAGEGPPGKHKKLLGEILAKTEELVSGRAKNDQRAKTAILKRVDSLLESQADEASDDGPAAPAAPPESEELSAKTREQMATDLEVLSSFLVEAVSHLDDIEERILAYENDPDPVLVNDIFRSVHTIKGVSSFLNLPEIRMLAHSMEFMLDDLRNGKMGMDSSICDVLLEATDVLTSLITELQDWYERIDRSKVRQFLKSSINVEPMIAKIEEGRSAAASGSAEGDTSTKEIRPADAGSGRVVETPVDPGFSIVKPAAPGMPEGYGDLFTDEMIQGFISESSDLMDETEHAILNLEKDPGNISFVDEAFRSVHTVKGNAGFFQYAEVEQLCMGLESFLDTFRKHSREVDPASITTILSAVDAIRSGLVLPGELSSPGERKSGDGASGESSGKSAAGSPTAGGDAPGASAGKPAGAGNLSPARAEQHELGEILVEMGVVDEEVVKEALEQQHMKVGELLVQNGAVSPGDVAKALERQGKTPSASEVNILKKRKRQDIRVDTERLDMLFNMVGELITAEAMVVNNPDIEKLNLENFRRASSTLSKVTREIQEITMAIRMIPLEGLFNKMRRLVRDLSRKFRKEILLDVSGDDTEMDRNVIDEVSDPLVHIIRNAIDHGIEEPAARKAAGKKPAGQLTLAARYEGNEVWISIVDDGKGLDRGKILSKAAERGIVSDASRDFSDEEIFQLIFEPGFSTAETVSEISGRGVGMDVVKKNIEKLRGKVSVNSEPGQGTEFILKIPLTLAIIEAIVFTVKDMLLSLPLIDILEFQKPGPSQFVETERGKTVLNVRGKLYPVIDIADFYGIDPGPSAGGAEPDAGSGPHDDEHGGLVIIAQGRGKQVALKVDNIIGNHQLVLKALPEYMGQVKAVSGCSIMGGGEVCLVVDTGTLVSMELE